MSRTSSERDRLLALAAVGAGLLSTIAALLCLVLPGSGLALSTIIVETVLLVVIAVAFISLQRRPTPVPLVVVVMAALIGVGVLALGDDSMTTMATVTVVGLLAGGCAGPTALLLGAEPRRRIILVVAFALTLAVALWALAASPYSIVEPVTLIVASWLFFAALSLWLTRLVTQTVHGIEGMSDAYRAERVASEHEARRRQGARLLHDTVLATLTLLAHSGRGVGETALREQASEDAALLRQLRMGFTPDPVVSGDYRLRPVDESTLGKTLESVKQRFTRMGLDVAWHGSGHVLLPSETLDAFLMALAESLENVRRHSGVDQAHVTITDDDVTVRAMVTDSGVGFDLGTVEAGRLGFAESIVARLRDVGGNARLFSAPGSGTTVVLEVPK